MRQLPTVIASLALVACSSAAAEPQRSYALALRVDSDPGEGLAGVGIEQGARRVGVTDAHGLARLELRGAEGTRVALTARCPATHLSPPVPTTVILRSYVGAEAPESRVRCPPRKRKLAVVVVAKNGGDLPLVHRGTELGRTDADGVAHLTLESEPGQAFEVTLDTSSRPALRPQNPGARFVMATRDEALLFEPALTVMEKQKRRRAAPKPDLPRRIR